jgi:SsrA-binding protein
VNATRPFAGTSKRSRRQPVGSKRHEKAGVIAGLDTAIGLARVVAVKGAQMAAKSDSKIRIVAQNRKARFNYQIGETFEAGIALTGTEVKSLRSGKATIAESYADARGGEIWLVNANIPEYLQGGRFNHAPKRMRKLLLHRRQINKLMGAVEREGMTLVPLKLYFNEKGRAKLELALARGKKLHDKRESEKRRSWERERGRLLRAKG